MKQKLHHTTKRKIGYKIIQNSINLITSFNKLDKIHLNILGLNELNIWVRRVKNQINLCNKLVRKTTMHVGSKRKIQTILGHLISIKKKILNNHIGLGLKNKNTKNQKKRIAWENVVSCFEGRVRTGVIINLIHKDINQFLNECSLLFQKKIKEILKSFSMLKVNTTFCGEFVKKSADKEVTDLKYFNTKNETIDAGTDLNCWFLNHVSDKILNKLSEFQERDSGFALQRIVNLEININKLEIGNGS